MDPQVASNQHAYMHSVKHYVPHTADHTLQAAINTGAIRTGASQPDQCQCVTHPKQQHPLSLLRDVQHACCTSHSQQTSGASALHTGCTDSICWVPALPSIPAAQLPNIRIAPAHCTTPHLLLQSNMLQPLLAFLNMASQQLTGWPHPGSHLSGTAAAAATCHHQVWCVGGLRRPRPPASSR